MKTTADNTVANGTGGLGQEKIGHLSSHLASPDNAANMGGPLDLDIRLIDEDPHQPRTKNNPGFFDESLNELAASIRLRGVKTPISVRDNPDAPGRYLINHGARRFRASQRADKATIPGFIDNDYNEADQVVENLQRNELTAREIADFIGRELAKGVKRGDIAKTISKSPAFVTQHAALLDLPDSIAKAFNSGRVKDVTVVNELVSAFKRNPLEVSNWLEDKSQEITRGAVKLLREFLENKQQRQQEQEEQEEPEDMSDSIVTLTGMTQADAAQGEHELSADSKKGQKELEPEKLKKAIVQVRHNDRSARLILNRRPPAEGFAWLKYDDDGQEFEANLSSVTLVALLEG
jgi:ParB family chromosome partitioning protein